MSILFICCIGFAKLRINAMSIYMVYIKTSKVGKRKKKHQHGTTNNNKLQCNKQSDQG